MFIPSDREATLKAPPEARAEAGAVTEDGVGPSDLAEPAAAVAEAAGRSRAASRILAGASSGRKDAVLAAWAEALVEDAPAILEANAEDRRVGRRAGSTDGLLDRLELTEARLVDCADGLRALIGLPDPVGQVVRGSTLANGLRLRQVRVPLGVVGMIYEARPNVTVDAAGLAFKSGNACLLRGGGAARRSNAAIVATLRRTLAELAWPVDLVQTIDPWGRPGAVALMRARGLVDVVIPRGGADLIATVVEQATVPVIETGVGNVHLYVDASADLDMALPILLNAKTQRVSVCNAAETLLVHADLAQTFLPTALAGLAQAGVVLHGDDRARAAAPAGVEVQPAQPVDWATEYLALEIAVRVVDSLAEALEHIRTWSSGHTEAIVTSDLAAAQRFVDGVDSAAVMVNASTRFTDGGQFGLGAEVGISTQKLHARGPMGLAELTTTKWIVWGQGQIRP
ncbi:MAG: glutamate-5-semialdehyde dehydrogenase [Propionibacteriaceae bacterium]|jgi:glutamate-5-semialdehyde dehydrogenase|nr:glutamate-5-semialdehyde dehydrogenase [Propionibacteriaceae bacterium]